MAAIDEALAAHRNGDIVRAEALYRQILKSDSRNFDALHMLGIVCAPWRTFWSYSGSAWLSLGWSSTLPGTDGSIG